MPSNLRKPEPAPDENFKSILVPLKYRNEYYAQEKKLCRFDLYLHKKKNLSAFFDGTWEKWWRGDKQGEEDEAKMLCYLLMIIKNHYANYSLMILYDNSLFGSRADRQIFKFLNDRVELNKLIDYEAIITKKLPDWMKL